jgi:biopolymer transport protein ExbD
MLEGLGRSEEPLFINLTPMIDVVLCLLIFFMAATRLYDWEEEQIQVNVPQVSQAQPMTSAPRDLSLVIDAPGRITLDKSSYDLKDLVPVLKQAREQYPDQGVIVRGPATLSYQDLADVLSACETAGIRNVRLSVRPKDEAPPPP